MKKALFTSLAMLAIVAGCQKENFRSENPFSDEQSVGGPVKTLLASTEKDSKASFDFESATMLWKEGDEIAVFAKESDKDTQARATFALTAGEETSDMAVFYSETGVAQSDTYYAVYPFSATTKNTAVVTKSDEALHVEYPTKQRYDANLSLAEGNNLMVAKISSPDSTSFDTIKADFANICSYVGLAITGPANDKIKSIIFESLDGSPVCGTASVTFNGTVPTVKFDEGQPSRSIIAFWDSASETEGLDFTSATFDFAVPAGLDNGFKITLVTCGGLSISKESDKALGRNQYIVMPEFDFGDPASFNDVAEMNGTQYKSFTEALAAANEETSNCTIKLLDDAYISTVAEVSNQSATVTLDLNGHTLTAVDVNRINVLADATLVIDDLSEGKTGVLDQANAASNTLLSYGHLIINNGTVKSGNTAVYVYNGTLEVNGGKFTSVDAGTFNINSTGNAQYLIDSAVFRGGVVESKHRGVYIAGCDDARMYDGFKVESVKSTVYVTENGGLNIYGGSYYCSGTNCIWAHDSSNTGKVTIYDGYFYTGNTVAVIYGQANYMTAYGGWYNRNVTSTYIPNGYQSVSKEKTYEGITYTLTIEKKGGLDATVQVGSGEPIQFPYIVDAINYADTIANETAIITVMNHCSIDKEINLTGEHKIILDLNGKTVSNSGANRINIKGENSDFVIRSTGENAAEGCMVQKVTGSYNINQTAGKLTIEGGKFLGAQGSTTRCMYTGGGEVTINGGVFENDYYETYRFQDCIATINGGSFTTASLNSSGEPYATPKAIYFTETSDSGAKTVGRINGGTSNSICAYANVDSVVINNHSTKQISSTGCPQIVIESGEYTGLVLSTATNLSSQGEIHIKGGHFTASETDTVAVYNKGSKVVNIYGGTFEGNSANKSRAFDAAGGTTNIYGGTFTASSKLGTVRACGGTVNIFEDAEIESTGTTDSRALYIGDGHTQKNAAKMGTVVINGGTFTAEDRCLQSYYGSLTIYDGTFKAGGLVLYTQKNQKTTTSITGGYFSTTGEEGKLFYEDGSDLNGSISAGRFSHTFPEAFVAPGMIITDTDPVTEGGITYTYSIISDPSAIDLLDVNGTKYKTFTSAAEAISRMTGNVTVKVETSTLDMASEFNLSGSANVTFDLNGKQVKGNIISSVPELKITDGSQEGTGQWVASDSKYAVEINAGKLTFDKGTILSSLTEAASSDADSATVVLRGDAKNAVEFNMTGGSIIMKGTKGGTAIGGAAGVAVLGNATFNMTGGTISAQVKGVFARSLVDNTNSTVNIDGEGVVINSAQYAFYTYTRGKWQINNGHFTSESGAIIHNGTSNTGVDLAIYGGYFNAKGYASQKYFNAYISGGGTDYLKQITLKGGYFNADPVANSRATLKFDKDNYEVKALGTPVEGIYGYQVVKKTL